MHDLQIRLIIFIKPIITIFWQLLFFTRVHISSDPFFHPLGLGIAQLKYLASRVVTFGVAGRISQFLRDRSEPFKFGNYTLHTRKKLGEKKRQSNNQGISNGTPLIWVITALPRLRDLLPRRFLALPVLVLCPKLIQPRPEPDCVYCQE